MESESSRKNNEQSGLQEMLRALRSDIIDDYRADFSKMTLKSRPDLERWATCHGVEAEKEVKKILDSISIKDENAKAVEELMTIWIIGYDSARNRMYLEDEAGGILCPKFIQSAKWHQSVVNRMVIPCGIGSIGYALSTVESLCLPNTMLDPRGTVAIEDYLLGNMSFASVPIFFKDPEKKGDRCSDNLSCYIGVGFPVENLWTNSGATCCRHQTKKDAACFVEHLEKIVRKYRTSIKLTMQLAREKSVVKAFSKLIKRVVFSAEEGMDKSGAFPKRYSLIKKSCFGDSVPSPLGVLQVLLLPFNSEESSILACSTGDLESTLEDKIREDTNKTAKNPDLICGGTENPASSFDRLLKEYGIDKKIKQVSILPDDLQGDMDDFELRFTIGLRKKEESLFKEEALISYIKKIKEYLGTENIRKKLIDAGIIDSHESNSNTQMKVIRSFQKLFLKCISEYLTGKKIDKFDDSSVLGVVSKQIFNPKEPLQELFPEEFVLKCIPLFVIVHVIEKHTNWQLDKFIYADDDIYSSSFEKRYKDQAVFNVQKYLVSLNESELEKLWFWDKDDGIVWLRITKNQEFLVRLTKPDCSIICSSIHGGRAFETKISSDDSIHRLFAAHREDKDGQRILKYYAQASNSDLSLKEILSTKKKPHFETIWKQHDDDMWIGGVSFDTSFIRMIEKTCSHTNSGNANGIINDVGNTADKDGLVVYFTSKKSSGLWSEYKYILERHSLAWPSKEKCVVVFPIEVDGKSKFLLNIFVHSSVSKDKNSQKDVLRPKAVFAESQCSLMQSAVDYLKEIEAETVYLKEQEEHALQVQQVSADLAHEAINGLLPVRNIVLKSGDKEAIESMEWVSRSIEGVDRAYRGTKESHRDEEKKPIYVGDFFTNIVKTIEKKHQVYAGVVRENYGDDCQLFKLDIDEAAEKYELNNRTFARDTWWILLMEVLYNAIKYCDFVYGATDDLKTDPYGIHIEIRLRNLENGKRLLCVCVRNGLWPGLLTDVKKAKQERAADLVSMGRFVTEEMALKRLSSSRGSNLVSKIIKTQYGEEPDPGGPCENERWEWSYEFKV